VTISKLEAGGTRSDASVEELFALAIALNVAPVHLLVALDDGDAVEIVPGLTVPAPLVRDWIRGGRPLPERRRLMADEEVLDWLAEQPSSEMKGRVRELITEQADPLALAMSGLNVEERAEDLAWEIQEGEQIRRRERKEKQ
jgi:hypothetical protein